MQTDFRFFSLSLQFFEQKYLLFFIRITKHSRPDSNLSCGLVWWYGSWRPDERYLPLWPYATGKFIFKICISKYLEIRGFFCHVIFTLNNTFCPVLSYFLSLLFVIPLSALFCALFLSLFYIPISNSSPLKALNANLWTFSLLLFIVIVVIFYNNLHKTF